ncbi:peptidyl-prolyl cis-trans isomerase [Acuticoccus kandeliae]|uniref:peptidylprolyl isomerase n=1 Tax=Acuticoccus kandeliae TaxID=2073160 RepID=UPI000D3E8EFC|nr:peptidylprolyl isomerase [Acuticoccus kandeliae]
MKLRPILASPLLHFFAAGGLVFLAYALMNPAAEEADAGGDRLELSDADARRLVAEFAAAWNRLPSEAELAGMMRDWAIEEALVREALALGLDKGDPAIRNRLRQKMIFLAEAAAPEAPADEATLEAFYRENAARFTRPGRLSFEQILLPAGSSAGEVAAATAALEDGADPVTLTTSALLPARIDAMAEPAVEQVFGGGFGTRVAHLSPGAWSGPVESAYGRHIVRLGERREGTLPPLASVRERVLAEWRAEETRKAREAYTEAVLARFSTALPDPSDILKR